MHDSVEILAISTVSFMGVTLESKLQVDESTEQIEQDAFFGLN